MTRTENVSKINPAKGGTPEALKITDLINDGGLHVSSSKVRTFET